jgi:enoyl-CoA hydratase
MCKEKRRNYVNYEFNSGLAVVTIDNPPVNSMTIDMSNELRQVFEELKTLKVEDQHFEKTRVEVVVLTAVTHGGIFIAGGDINLFMDLKTRNDGEEISRFYHSVINPIAEFERPVICAIDGLALGGGTEVALACDIRIASPKAEFGLTEVQLGLFPAGGGTQRLPRLIGPGKAKKIIFTGERIDAEEALRIGLIEKLVPEGGVLSEAKKMAQAMLNNAPTAIKCAKMAIDEGLNSTLTKGLLIEEKALGEVCDGGEQLEGAKAFLEKRKPKFT